MARLRRAAGWTLILIVKFLVLASCQNPIEIKIISDLLATESRMFSNRYGRSYQFNVTDLDASDSFHSLQVGSSRSQGEYKILLPDNRWQIVSYVADDKGYRATVRYETVDHTPISEETQGGSESYWAGSVGSPSPPKRIPSPDYTLPTQSTKPPSSYYLKPSRPEAPQRDPDAPYPVVSQVNTYIIHPAPDESSNGKWSPPEPVRPTYYPPAPLPVRPSARDPYVPRPQGPPIVPIRRPPALIETQRPIYKAHTGYQVAVPLSGLQGASTTTTQQPQDDDEIQENMKFNPNQYHPFWEPQAEKPQVVLVPLRPVNKPVEEPKRPATPPPDLRPSPPTPPRPEPTIKPHSGYNPAHSGYPKPHSGYGGHEYDEEPVTKRPVYPVTQSYKLAPRPDYQPTKPQAYRPEYNYRPSEPPAPAYRRPTQPIGRPEYIEFEPYPEPPTAVYQTSPKYAPYRTTLRPGPVYQAPKSSGDTKWSQPAPEQYSSPYRPTDYSNEPVRIKADPYAFDPFESFKPTEGPYGNYPHEAQTAANPPYESYYERPAYEEGTYGAPPPASFNGPQVGAPVETPPEESEPPQRPVVEKRPAKKPVKSFDEPLFYRPSFARGRTSTTTTAPVPADADFDEPSILLSKFKFRPKSKLTTSDGFGTRTQPLKRNKGQSTSTETIVYDWQDPASFLPASEAHRYNDDDSNLKDQYGPDLGYSKEENSKYNYEGSSKYHYDSIAQDNESSDEVTTKRPRLRQKVKAKTTTTTTTEQPDYPLEPYVQDETLYESPFETSHKAPSVPYDAPYDISYDGSFEKAPSVPYEVAYDIPYGGPFESADPSIEPPYESTTQPPIQETSPLAEPTTTTAPSTTESKTTTTPTSLPTEVEAETTPLTTTTTTATPAPTTKRSRKKKKKRLRPKSSRKSKYRSKSKSSDSAEAPPSVEVTSSGSSDVSTTAASTTSSSTTTAPTSTKRPTRVRFPPRIKYTVQKSGDRVIRHRSYDFSSEDDLIGDAAEMIASLPSNRRNDDESHVITALDIMDATLNSIPIDRLALVDFDEADDTEEDDDDDDEE